MKAREALEMATLGGAAVLGRDDIGALAPGMSADFAAYRIDTPAFAGAQHDPVAALVLCGSQNVDLSMINGRVVVRDGELQTVDLPVLVEQHNAISRRLLRRRSRELAAGRARAPSSTTNGDLLLSRRGDLNTWALPGGRLDPGERLEDAAAREVRRKPASPHRSSAAVALYYLDGWQRMNVLFAGFPLGGELRRCGRAKPAPIATSIAAALPPNVPGVRDALATTSSAAAGRSRGRAAISGGCGCASAGAGWSTG